MKFVQSIKYFCLHRIHILLLFFICVQQVQAQYDDTSVYYLKANLTGVYNKTNTTESYLTNNTVRFAFSKKKTLINVYGGWVYGKQKTGLTNNDYNVATDYNVYNDKQILFFWGYGAYDNSYSLKIDSRLQVGSGIGYDVLKSAVFSLSLSDGLVYEYNNYAPSPDPLYNDFETFRNSFRVKYLLYVHKVIKLRGSNYWQQSLESESDYIFKFTNSMEFKIRKWLSFTIATTYNKVNRTSRENFLLTYGLTFDKTF
ncbi:DUF481 domain-containing protein [Cytophaga aurantiaca]|uniref:DUF481 domain-containing protein n=1 Tax=Cytophaga aurantiaca TaxID=29530 RepID=UPI00036E6E83|nr:DUF481 domain-containing protein [Cytophaga aurantiaca]